MSPRNPKFKIEIVENTATLKTGETYWVWEQNEREIFFYDKVGRYMWLPMDEQDITWRRAPGGGGSSPWEEIF